MNIFPYIFWETPQMCVETLTNCASFSQMIDLRDHMPRFTQKINIFPSISSKTPEMYV